MAIGGRSASSCNNVAFSLLPCYHIAVVGESIRILRAQGYKATKPRRLVLQVLEEVEKPLSPYLIQEILRRRGNYLNHVTIYRILDLLCHLNLAHKMASGGGFVKCSLNVKEGCHRFMVCQQCGAIQEFADEGLCQKENEFARDLGFHTEYHLSQFFGLCAHCYRK
ncbi:MAG: Fur family transcriptional regulator [Dehalococcoidia bacterium]